MAIAPDGIIVSSPRHDRSVRRILEADIGEERIVTALQMATGGEPPDQVPSALRQLLDRLSDPTYAEHSLPMLMRSLGVSLFDVLDAVRKTDGALAIANSGKRLGAVVDGLGEAAEPRWAICGECMGEGQVADDDDDAQTERASVILGCDNDDADIGESALADLPMRKCLAIDGGCDGTGKVRIRGNLDAAKLFLEVHGLKKSGGAAGGGVNVTVPVQQINNAPADDARSPQAKTIDVMARVQGILENGG